MRKLQQNPLYQTIVKEKGAEIFETMDPEVVLREQVISKLNLLGNSLNYNFLASTLRHGT